MLELKNIYFSVIEDSNVKEILKNINISIEEKSFTVITGPNGSGKSTLAKIVMGIENPTSGKIIFNGEDITNFSVSQRAKLGISFAFQQPIRFKGLKVKDLISLSAGEVLSVEKACEYLSEVGLCAKEYVERDLDSTLSGGEMKRIEIAMLIARKTKLSIFDEPEAGIDLWSFNNLIQVFTKMRKEIKGSIIVISHQERILNIADNIVVLSEGKILQEGKKDDILPNLLKINDNACDFHKGVTF